MKTDKFVPKNNKCRSLTLPNMLQIVKVRLPKDDRESGRLKGFGYVEFEERADLKEALGMTDTVSHLLVVFGTNVLYSWKKNMWYCFL